MACGWSTRWNWPMGSLSGRSISRQMSSVRVIRQKDYGTNRWWHKPTALSTANKAYWTEQITITKEWLKELMMTDELRGRDKEEVARVASKWIIPTSPMMFSFALSQSLSPATLGFLTNSISLSFTCLYGFFYPSFILLFYNAVIPSSSPWYSLNLINNLCSDSDLLFCKFFFFVIFSLSSDFSFFPINYSFPPLLPQLPHSQESWRRTSRFWSSSPWCFSCLATLPVSIAFFLFFTSTLFPSSFFWLKKAT